jgi:hypothetical protein
MSILKFERCDCSNGFSCRIEDAIFRCNLSFRTNYRSAKFVSNSKALSYRRNYKKITPSNVKTIQSMSSIDLQNPYAGLTRALQTGMSSRSSGKIRTHRNTQGANYSFSLELITFESNSSKWQSRRKAVTQSYRAYG